jgi:predicted anti-sigma-YlaC factor YlaD
MRRMAVNKVGNALASGGATFSGDEDPELVRAAVPFSLKLMESLLAESPRHRPLLLATTRGFTQYSYAFLQQDADELEDHDLAAAQALRKRAQRLYLRARDYGLRGLEVRHRGFDAALREDPKAAVASLHRRAEVPLLYWTAASWGAAIALSKDDPEIVADQLQVEALIDRALQLDEGYEAGAIHGFLVSYEGSRQGGPGQAESRAREHFQRAVELSEGKLASPFVALAENVAVGAQNRAEFQELLKRALAVDPNARPEWRLENLVMQRRARWLLARTDRYFAE